MNKYIYQFVKIAFGIVILLALIYAGIRLGTVAYDFGYRVFTEPAMEEAPGRDVTVQITKGMSAREFGRTLQEKGLIRDANLFFLQYELSAKSLKKLYPGVYTLNTSMTAKDILVIVSVEPEPETETESETESETQQMPVPSEAVPPAMGAQETN